ncbi:MAG: hypothetical protein R3B40_32605, partial [Polyangiales bacterium]
MREPPATPSSKANVDSVVDACPDHPAVARIDDDLVFYATVVSQLDLVHGDPTVTFSFDALYGGPW